MNVTTYADIEQGTEEWLEVRRGILTASTIGQLITPTGKVAANDKSRALVLQLIAERITGYMYPTFTSDDMMRGHLAEEYARNWYSQEHATVQQVGFMRLDAEWGTLGYSPDGLVGDDGLIEVKSPRHKGHLKTVLDDAVPAEYMAQIQAGLLVSGRAWCDYISWPGGMAPYVTRVTPDPEWQDALKAVVEHFESDVTDKTAIYTERTTGIDVPPLIETYEPVELKL